MKKAASLAVALAAAFAQAGAQPPDQKPAVGEPKQLSASEAADTLSEDELREVVDILRENYLRPDALSETSLARAGIQGLLERLGAGARIYPAAEVMNSRPSPFRSEILVGNVGYLRLGALTPENISSLDGALESFAPKPPPAVVLDLRATPHSTDFELAAECCRRFAPKGRVLFSIKRPKVNDEEILTSRSDPLWRGVLVVLVDGDTAGAGEVIAAVLRTHLRAYIIGQQTKGEAAQFEDLPLSGGKILRVAIGEVTLPDATPVFPGGLAPDLVVNVTQEGTDEVLALALNAGGLSPLVTEKQRARMNEAALIAGTNPELDELQEVQRLKAKGEAKPKPPRDEVVQRALDFITSIRIYQGRGTNGTQR
jgi:C-terminal processing protease CtpA/Prc